jgi:hypothetical protein
MTEGASLLDGGTGVGICDRCHGNIQTMGTITWNRKPRGGWERVCWECGHGGRAEEKPALIDTKAVLGRANGGTTRLIGNIRVDKPQGWCRWCLSPMDEHDEDCPVAALAQEIAQRDALWQRCHIVYWPPGQPLTYPIEHNLAAKKDNRRAIETALAAEAQK